MAAWKLTLQKEPMRRGLTVAKAAYDAEAAFWFVDSSDLESVNAEAPSLEALLQKFPRGRRSARGGGLDDVELPTSWLPMPARECAGAPPLEGLRQGREGS